MGMMSSDDYDTGTQAAAAGGVTCLVDFAIQREPDQLRSALAEWQGRADGAAHVDYGFHMAITNANEATIDDMAAIVDAGVSSFKLFMAYKGELMTRDDAMTAVHGARPRPRRADHGPRRERRRRRPARQARAARRPDRRDPPRADAPGVRRGRGDLARRAAGRVHRRVAVRRPRHLRRGRRRDPGRPAARRRRSAPRPARSTSSTRSTTCAGRASRAVATSARRRCATPPTTSRCGTTCGAGSSSRVSTDHCPFTNEQKARGLENFSLVPNGLAVIQHRLAKLWDEGVVAGRITPSQLVDRTSTTIARRFGLERKGAIAPGKDADIVVFDPSAPRDYGTHTSFMNVDYDLYEGETASGSRPPHALARDAGLRPRRDRHRARPRPLRGTRGRGGRGDRMTLTVDAERVLADLHELAARERGRARGRQAAGVVAGLDGRARVAAGQARRDRRRQRRPRRGRATSGPSCPGTAAPRASSSSARTSTRCRRAAGWTARWADGRAGGPAHARGGRRAAAGRRSGWSTGPTRRARASAAASSAPRRSPARSTPTTSAACATRSGMRLQDAMAVGRRRPRRRVRPPPRAWTARAPTSSCTSSRARSCSTAAGSASAVSGTFGDERYLVTFSGQSAHAGLDADAPASRHARRRGDRRAGDPRGRHPPRRRHDRRRDHLVARR